MCQVCKSEIAKRALEEEKFKRQDFLDIMLQARKKKGNGDEMTDDMIARTSMQFFLDGYDTVSAQLAMALYFLALNPDAQVSFTKVEMVLFALSINETNFTCKYIWADGSSVTTICYWKSSPNS